MTLVLFSLRAFRCQFCCPFFVLPLLGLLSGVKPHLKLLAMVIPYSWNPRVRYDIVFSLGPFYINKKQFFYPCFLLTSKGDFKMKAPPQTCQQSIFRILMAPQINSAPGLHCGTTRSWRCHCRLCRTSTAVAPRLRCDGGITGVHRLLQT